LDPATPLLSRRRRKELQIEGRKTGKRYVQTLWKNVGLLTPLVADPYKGRCVFCAQASWEKIHDIWATTFSFRRLYVRHGLRKTLHAARASTPLAT